MSLSNESTFNHGRQGSGGGRAALPRRSTRGPLDISQAPVSGPSSPLSPQVLTLPASQRPPISRSPSRLVADTHVKDFSKLLRPEIYHPLTQLKIPPIFRTSSKQPSPETPLDTLLSTGHFRAAAILSAQQLTSSVQPADFTTIFDLFYIRLVCLCLSGMTAMAAQEVKALEDLNSSTYRDDLSGRHLVPWELRVLAVRLQGIGFSDPRKGVMGYYDLAREARIEMSKLSAEEGSEEKEKLERKLGDLGIRVASALVEMEDLDGAAHHLSTLGSSSDPQLEFTKALLWLRVGDLDAAQRCVSGDVDNDAVISALSRMADGEYSDAVAQWTRLCERDSGNEMFAQNLAVCLLYSGRMQEGRDVLEKLVDNGKSFHALTFNLSTIYELCADRSQNLKLKLAEQVASLPHDGGLGWEKTNLDFKL